jgi:hypothetical protein
MLPIFGKIYDIQVIIMLGNNGRVQRLDSMLANNMAPENSLLDCPASAILVL